jgi:alpha-maltose-1-phosphate synthase
MKCLVLYAHPPEPDGQSLQGYLLYKGISQTENLVTPCHFKDSFQKDIYLKDTKPDVAFGIGFWGNVPDVIREPLRCGVKPVPWFNADGWIANYHEDFNALDLMFTTSNWVKDTYKRDGIDISKIIPMHIGIDTATFSPSSNIEMRNAIRRSLGIGENEKMILTIGGDTTSKGSQEMMRALSEVNKEYKDWKFVCKSWTSECAMEWREHELELAESLGISDKVIFMEDEFDQLFTSHFINAADIYAAPSRLEGFGMLQVEAMSCGKPVISINKMGPSETIIHNKTGFLASVSEEIKLDKEWVYPSMGFDEKRVIKFDEPKTFAYRADIEELRKYTLKLLTDPELCNKMGNSGREHALNNFDYRIVSKKILEITKDKLGLK